MSSGSNNNGSSPGGLAGQLQNFRGLKKTAPPPPPISPANADPSSASGAPGGGAGFVPPPPAPPGTKKTSAVTPVEEIQPHHFIPPPSAPPPPGAPKKNADSSVVLPPPIEVRSFAPIPPPPHARVAPTVQPSIPAPIVTTAPPPLPGAAGSAKATGVAPKYTSQPAPAYGSSVKKPVGNYGAPPAPSPYAPAPGPTAPPGHFGIHLPASPRAPLAPGAPPPPGVCAVLPSEDELENPSPSANTRRSGFSGGPPPPPPTSSSAPPPPGSGNRPPVSNFSPAPSTASYGAPPPPAPSASDMAPKKYEKKKPVFGGAYKPPVLFAEPQNGFKAPARSVPASISRGTIIRDANKYYVEPAYQKLREKGCLAKADDKYWDQYLVIEWDTILSDPAFIKKYGDCNEIMGRIKDTCTTQGFETSMTNWRQTMTNNLEGQEEKTAIHAIERFIITVDMSLPESYEPTFIWDKFTKTLTTLHNPLTIVDGIGWAQYYYGTVSHVEQSRDWFVPLMWMLNGQLYPRCAESLRGVPPTFDKKYAILCSHYNNADTPDLGNGQGYCKRCMGTGSVRANNFLGTTITCPSCNGRG